MPNTICDICHRPVSTHTLQLVITYGNTEYSIPAKTLAYLFNNSQQAQESGYSLDVSVGASWALREVLRSVMLWGMESKEIRDTIQRVKGDSSLKACAYLGDYNLQTVCCNND